MTSELLSKASSLNEEIRTLKRELATLSHARRECKHITFTLGYLQSDVSIEENDEVILLLIDRKSKRLKELEKEFEAL